jgi:hypothetical protein
MEEMEETTAAQGGLAGTDVTPPDGQDPARGSTTNTWKTVGMIVAVLVLILIGSAVFYGLATHPRFTAVLRDISIIVLALVTMITSVLLAVLLFQLQSLIVLLRDEVQPILESINETAGTVRGTTTFVSDSVVSPAIEVAGYISGVSTSLRTLFKGPSSRSTASTASRSRAQAAETFSQESQTNSPQ